ncbi:hypothetical protein [Streptacidiphilus jiangxiensis]|uniref:Secreted protein n=1 Tax=Streptacidiphilus jiangxiensis TaxID=235985 RepID=A0A1H7UAZ2_STRJI|nr:hypothetical protein [Streptacidiphilus jiangxiensis]SEL94183.1 hypothetical protein SAMN05414137_115185 [Streptacidiphilus jiangxiensis]
MEPLGILMLLVLCMVAAIGTLVVVGAVKAARAVSTKAENVALKARAYTNPGAPGRIASVRLRLRAALEGTRQALEAAASQDAQVGESLQLLKRLETHGTELDAQLRGLEREPEPTRVDAKLPELRARAEQITHAAEELRWAVQDRQHRFSEDELSRLSDECTQEADALRHWSRPAQADEAAAGGPHRPEPGRLTTGRWPTADEVLGFVDRIRRPSGETNAR